MDAPTAAMSSNAPPDPELKAKLASLVGRLTTELGIGGGRSAEGLATASVAMLSKMISPYDVTKVAQQQSQRLLTERAPDPEAFAAQFSAWTLEARREEMDEEEKRREKGAETGLGCSSADE